MRRTCLIIAMIAAAALPLSAAPRELPPKLSEADLARIVAKAPALPVDLNHGLALRLIDFVDCTDPNDPHEFLDQGTSRVVDGPAGRYRLSAMPRHSFFAYRHKSPGPDRAMLIVIEYPDDAERHMSFMTHDSTRPGRAHLSFSLEGGVYTGRPLPLSNKMQYFTYIAWSPDEWPAMIFTNFKRAGGGAAASRMWVYAVTEPMPPLGQLAGSQRKLDLFVCLSFLAKRDNFGHNSTRSIEHMVEYCRYIGVNSVTMMVYANQGWGAACTIEAWDADGKGYLEDILDQMDRVGGVDLIAGIVADGMYGVTRSGGKAVADMEPAEAKQVVLKGFDQFIDRYGKYRSLRGVALGSMEAVGFCDMLRGKGILDEVVAHIHKRRPDWRVITYLGNYRLQNHYFNGRAESPTAGDVVGRWETSGREWSEFLADEVLANWRRWKRDPVVLKSTAGLLVHDMYMADDHQLQQLYSQEPRAMVYYDVNRSQRRSDHISSEYASIFSTFSEGWVGLKAGYNFWYDKDWTGPDFNPAAPQSLASFATVMAHRDRKIISAGSWTMKYFGYEMAMRRFAAAFHSLPPVMLADVPGAPVDTLVGRWVRHEGRRYISLQSVIPFGAEVAVDGKQVVLPPYELVTLVDDGEAAPVIDAEVPEAYRRWVAERIKRYHSLYRQVWRLNSAAAPAVYETVGVEAERLLVAGRVHAADLALGAGLENELRLRRDILAPPVTKVPRIPAPQRPDDLDAWPAAAADIAVGGDHLPGHIFFPNSWTGEKDLSARIRLGHDGTSLYVAVEVRDDTLDEADGVNLRFSANGYLDWRAEDVGPDFAWAAGAATDGKTRTGEGSKGFRYECRRTADGYLVTGSAPLAEMGLAADSPIGFILYVSDRDGPESLKTKRIEGGGGERAVVSWAMKQALLYPNQPNFTFWSDGRCFGQLVLE